MGFRSLVAAASLVAGALAGLADRLSESAREFRRLSRLGRRCPEEIPDGPFFWWPEDDCLPMGVLLASAGTDRTTHPQPWSFTVRLRIGAYRCRGLFGRKHDWRMRRPRPTFRSGTPGLPS